jgi:hypothetical protein
MKKRKQLTITITREKTFKGKDVAVARWQSPSGEGVLTGESLHDCLFRIPRQIGIQMEGLLLGEST